MRVLAAEDNPVFQSMLRTMLTKWGYQPVIARSGTEAWRILESEDAPRLAVLDWMMPGMDGVEICRRVRSANREPYIYILLLTARTESQDLIEGWTPAPTITSPSRSTRTSCASACTPDAAFSTCRRNCSKPGKRSANRPPTMA
jgi:CheY-like chemotaxis protein